MCGGESCEYWKTHEGFHLTSCRSASNQQDLSEELSEAQNLASGNSCVQQIVSFETDLVHSRRTLQTSSYVHKKSNMYCRKPVTFVATFDKLSLADCQRKCDEKKGCGALLHTSINACKLLSGLDECAVRTPGKQALYERLEISPPTQNSYEIYKDDVFCQSSVKFIATFSKLTVEECEAKCDLNSKCSAFLHTAIRSCKLLASEKDCTTRAGTNALYRKSAATASPTAVTPSPTAITPSPTSFTPSPSHADETHAPMTASPSSLAPTAAPKLIFAIAQGNVYCSSSTKFIRTLTKMELNSCKEACAESSACTAFLFTTIKSCRLLASAKDCKTLNGNNVLYQQIIATKSPTETDNDETDDAHASGPSAWKAIYSLVGEEELASASRGLRSNAVLLLEAVISVREEDEGPFILGLYTSGQAQMFVNGESVLRVTPDTTHCGASGFELAMHDFTSNNKVSVQYIHKTGAPLLKVIVYKAGKSARDNLKDCKLNPDGDDIKPLPPDTIFTFGNEDCEAGYGGTRCTVAICEDKCENGGACAAPDTCSCTDAFGGALCQECASGYVRLFGDCQQLWMVVVGSACIAFIIVGALLAPRVKEYVELRKFSRFIEDEMMESFYSTKDQKWTANRLMTSKNGGIAREKFKDSPMWKLIASQKKPNLNVLKAHFIPKSQLNMGKVFATGASGQVCSATYDSMPVCVKQLYSLLIDPDDMGEFINEASILAQMSHPQIVRFYGVAVDSEGLFIVTELCASSLEAFMRSRWEAGKQITVLHKIAILLQIARGMEYVHSLGLVHRDLKIGNILVENANTEGFVNAKICDFGVSTCTGENKYKELVGTPGHIAPEVIIGDVKPDLVKKVDVFSFGMLAWSLFEEDFDPETNSMHASFDTSDDLNKAIAKRFRPQIRASWPDEIRSLINDCWNKNPRARPAFSEAAGRLSNILAKKGTSEYSDVKPSQAGSPQSVVHKSWLSRIRRTASNLLTRRSTSDRRPSGPPPPEPPSSRNGKILSVSSGKDIDTLLPEPRKSMPKFTRV